MKCLYVIFCCLICVGGYLNAQQITFERNYGYLNHEFGQYIQQTPDDGYIILGTRDFELIRTDSIGSVIWIKLFNGYGEKIEYTNDGGYIIVGGLSINLIDVYIIKIDAQGDSVWSKAYGGSDTDLGYSIAQTSDSGYIVVGRTISFGAGSWDVYLIKTDKNGDTLWTKTYGGNDKDWGHSVIETADSGYIVVGKTRSFGAGNYDVYLIKTNANGDTLWTKTYGGSYFDEGYDVQRVQNNGYIIIGRKGWFDGLQYGSCLYLIRIDENTDTLWTKVYCDSITSFVYGYSIRVTNDGGYIITGEWNDNIYLMKTDANGDILWTRTFTEGQANCVQQTNDKGYVLVGDKYISTLTGYDVYVIKTDSLGNVYNEISCYYLTANFTQSNDTIDLAASGTIQFTDGSSNAAGWYWDFGDGNTDIGQNPGWEYRYWAKSYSYV